MHVELSVGVVHHIIVCPGSRPSATCIAVMHNFSLRIPHQAHAQYTATQAVAALARHGTQALTTPGKRVSIATGYRWIYYNCIRYPF